MLFLYTGLFLLAFALAYWFTGQVRNYALKQNVLDIPNERSSHTMPTPRGGGVSVVVVFLCAICVLAIIDSISITSFIAFGGAGVLVAAVGFLDDHGHIAARWRLLAHFSSALLIVILFGGLPDLVIFGFEIGFAEFGYVLAVLYLVWLLNLYNFMDGIDGLASIQAITVCVGAAICSLVLHEWRFSESSALPIVLASAVAGFLVWNFPPAKIFMGDACSGFLGGHFSLHSVECASRPGYGDPELCIAT